MPLDQEQVDAFCERIKAERRAKGQPELISSERVHRILGAVIDTDAQRAASQTSASA